jgi:hypothetical protein
VLARQIGRLGSGLVLLRDCNNLLFRLIRFIVRPLLRPDPNSARRKDSVAGQPEFS